MIELAVLIMGLATGGAVAVFKYEYDMSRARPQKLSVDWGQALHQALMATERQPEWLVYTPPVTDDDGYPTETYR